MRVLILALVVLTFARGDDESLRVRKTNRALRLALEALTAKETSIGERKVGGEVKVVLNRRWKCSGLWHYCGKGLALPESMREKGCTCEETEVGVWRGGVITRWTCYGVWVESKIVPWLRPWGEYKKLNQANANEACVKAGYGPQSATG